MLKNILKLDGAKKLSKSEQKSINGGGGNEFVVCCPDDDVIISYPSFNCKFIDCQR